MKKEDNPPNYLQLPPIEILDPWEAGGQKIWSRKLTTCQNVRKFVVYLPEKLTQIGCANAIMIMKNVRNNVNFIENNIFQLNCIYMNMII